MLKGVPSAAVIAVAIMASDLRGTVRTVERQKPPGSPFQRRRYSNSKKKKR